MRAKQSVNKELEEKKDERRKVKSELSEHESALSPRIEPIKNKISEIERIKSEIVTPKVSPLFVVFAVLLAAFAFANMVYFKWKYLTLVALGLIVIILVIRYVVQKNMNKPFEEERNKKDYQIEELRKEISKVEDTDPQISLLRKQIHSIDSDIHRLNTELKNIEVCEKIGTNSLVISVNNKNAFYHYVNSEAKLISVNRYISHIKVDGQDRGTVGSPVSIISLTPGIHSLTVEFDPNADGNSFTTQPYQFTLNDSNKYYSFKNMKYMCAGKDKGFTFDNAAFNDLDSFLSHAEIEKAEFENFINNL